MRHSVSAADEPTDRSPDVGTRWHALRVLLLHLLHKFNPSDVPVRQAKTRTLSQLINMIGLVRVFWRGWLFTMEYLHIKTKDVFSNFPLSITLTSTRKKKNLKTKKKLQTNQFRRQNRYLKWKLLYKKKKRKRRKTRWNFPLNWMARCWNGTLKFSIGICIRYTAWDLGFM